VEPADGSISEVRRRVANDRSVLVPNMLSLGLVTSNAVAGSNVELNTGVGLYSSTTVNSLNLSTAE